MGQSDSTDYSQSSDTVDYSGLLDTAITTAGGIAVAAINQNKPAAPTIVYSAGAAAGVVPIGTSSNTPIILAALVAGGLYLASQSKSHPAGH